MPAENLEEQGLEKNPDLNLAQLKFSLTLNDFKNDSKIKEELMQAIQKDSKWLLVLGWVSWSFFYFYFRRNNYWDIDLFWE